MWRGKDVSARREGETLETGAQIGGVGAREGDPDDFARRRFDADVARVGRREAASVDETCRALLGTFGGSPNGDKTRAGGADGHKGPKRDARAGSRDLRSRHREGARSPRSLLAAHHGLHRALVSPAERAKTAPAFPPQPQTGSRCRGNSAPGRKALFRKRGAVLGAREPHVVGRFDVHRPSIDENHQGAETIIQDERRPRKLRVMIPGSFSKIISRCRPRGRCASPLGARSFPSLLSPSLSPLSPSLPSLSFLSFPSP